eukprot:1782538-Pyramimonas_sp.AAC.1
MPSISESLVADLRLHGCVEVDSFWERAPFVEGISIDDQRVAAHGVVYSLVVNGDALHQGRALPKRVHFYPTVQPKVCHQALRNAGHPRVQM